MNIVQSDEFLKKVARQVATVISMREESKGEKRRREEREKESDDDEKKEKMGERERPLRREEGEPREALREAQTKLVEVLTNHKVMPGKQWDEAKFVQKMVEAMKHDKTSTKVRDLMKKEGLETPRWHIARAKLLWKHLLQL